MMYVTPAVCPRVSVFMTIVTFVLSGFVLLGPYWLSSHPSVDHICSGLYIRCYDECYGNCSVIDLSQEENWYQACSGMWAGGTVVMLACAIGAMSMCCSCCRGRGCATILTVGSFFATGLFISTVVLYGIKLGNLFDRDESTYYEWGYYLSWGASLLSLITSAVFSCSIYQIGRINSMY